MPKEDPQSHPPPLKRGDACLYCRKRRIRCSATKPTCTHCAKIGRECVYDVKKPTSRVQQLEEKVAQLESLLRNGAMSGEGVPSAPGLQANGSTPSLPHQSSDNTSPEATPLPQQISTSTSYSFLNNETLDVNLFGGKYPAIPPADNDFNLFPSFGGSIFGSIGSIMPQPQPQAEQAFDFSALDPTFMNMVNSFQISTGLTEPIPQPQQQQQPMAFGQSPAPPAPPSHLNAVQASINPHTAQPFPLSTSAEPMPQTYTSLPKLPFLNNNFCTSVASEALPTNPSVVAELASASANVHEDMDALLKATAAPSAEQWATGMTQDLNFDRGQENTQLVGGWFDANDLPKVARDHLLNLFFSGMRLFGQEFHVPRFMASLSLPLSKRPHNCLLYSMYTMASRISTSQPIRNLEPHFHSIACRQLELAITQADKLLDAIRASSILAVYKYSIARYHEGWMMSGQAARLAISCGLHQIQSSVWKSNNNKSYEMVADLGGLMRHRSYILPPPVDAVEHGERIWAFWSIFVVDRCGSISTQWVPAIPDDVIITPFPRPLHEYELGLVTEADNISISSIYAPSPPRSRPLRYDYADLVNIRLRAITLLERASKLMYLPPEPGWDANLERHRSESSGSTFFLPKGPDEMNEYLSSPSGSGSTFTSGLNHTDTPGRFRKNKGWTKTAKVRNSKAYNEVRQALLLIEEDLPEEWRTNWLEWDGKVQAWHFNGARKDIISLHLVLGCAWMFIEDIYVFGAENTTAVNIAKRLTVTVRYLAQQAAHSDLDAFTAMMWSFMSKVLIREMKRCEFSGDKLGAAAIEPDIDTLVQALKQFGQGHAVAVMQAMRQERYKNSNWEDVEFMKGDDESSSDEETVWQKKGGGR
ncbi:hypothetical protein I308_100120 [Cryptococcus tetragattii IND107]|uniref:Zn(2)-C6 fungal-type domain-containing protein n=1 Tax=Cryptococcus tetragattii IND107 TaxID=1296105 RepID=A0ABR3C3Y2_9TREE|nr:hypothetical protein I308_04445 [Cryptococcus tetragattii IND107]